MNQSEINHWAKVAVDLEVAGEIDSLHYERARAFAFGDDPLPICCWRPLGTKPLRHEVIDPGDDGVNTSRGRCNVREISRRVCIPQARRRLTPVPVQSVLSR